MTRVVEEREPNPIPIPTPAASSLLPLSINYEKPLVLFYVALIESLSLAAPPCHVGILNRDHPVPHSVNQVKQLICCLFGGEHKRALIILPSGVEWSIEEKVGE